MPAYYERRGFDDVQIGEWEGTNSSDDDSVGSMNDSFNLLSGVPQRLVTYTMPKTALLKSQKVNEVQRLTRFGDKGFVLEATISTPNAPYGRDFEADVMYIVYRGVGGDGDDDVV
ncbi:hypothetical protein TrRE_jg7472 [Triparma retinervis]|uniref:VASt domain-containing protein n=1 Tax=Triparma retinervis TaxID=2557542 RepID=A0A9W6ZZ33_9STRA|nr:hypothetical protein TrRE_jg7472 [Triparma retinervis]